MTVQTASTIDSTETREVIGRFQTKIKRIQGEIRKIIERVPARSLHPSYTSTQRAQRAGVASRAGSWGRAQFRSRHCLERSPQSSLGEDLCEHAPNGPQR